MDLDACPISADLNVSLSLQTTEGKGRSPGHVHKSLPRPLLPDPNSNHTHTHSRVKVAGGCPSVAAMKVFVRAILSVTPPLGSVLLQATSTAHVSVTSSYVWPQLPFLSLWPLFFLFPFLTLTQTPESYSLAHMGLLKRRAEGKKGSGSLSLWNLLVNHQ